MAFTPKKQAFNAAINAVTIGAGEKSIVIGGENILPFYTFDNAMANSPKIAMEISDKGIAALPTAGLKAAFEGCATPADMAKKAEEMKGVSAICLRFESADPNGDNMSVEECVEIAKSVAAATVLPILVMGCKNVEKDAEILSKCSEALQGKNIVVLSAREENYKGVGASAGMAYNQKVGAESAVDINLAKQLNVLISQLGVDLKNVVMNLGSSAAGYGYEYLSSTLDRVKAAALAQNDKQLQAPIITPVSTETWGVKEAMVSEEEEPAWGSVEERAIEMEIATAAADLTSGSDMVIMKHPVAIATIADFIDALM